MMSLESIEAANEREVQRRNDLNELVGRAAYFLDTDGDQSDRDAALATIRLIKNLGLKLRRNRRKKA